MMDVGASFGKMRSPNPAQGGGDFSNWTQRHRELNPISRGPVEPKPSPYGMTQAPGLQPSTPGISQNSGLVNRNPIQRQGGFNPRAGFGGNFNPMPMPQIRPEGQLPPGLLELLQLFGSSDPNMFFGGSNRMSGQVNPFGLR